VGQSRVPVDAGVSFNTGASLFLTNSPIKVKGDLSDYCVSDGTEYVVLQLQISVDDACHSDSIYLGALGFVELLTVTIHRGNQHLTSKLIIAQRITNGYVLIGYGFDAVEFRSFINQSCEKCFTLYFDMLRVGFIDPCVVNHNARDKDGIIEHFKFYSIIRLINYDNTIRSPLATPVEFKPNTNSLEILANNDEVRHQYDKATKNPCEWDCASTVNICDPDDIEFEACNKPAFGVRCNELSLLNNPIHVNGLLSKLKDEAGYNVSGSKLGIQIDITIHQDHCINPVVLNEIEDDLQDGTSGIEGGGVKATLGEYAYLIIQGARVDLKLCESLSSKIGDYVLTLTYLEASQNTIKNLLDKNVCYNKFDIIFEKLQIGKIKPCGSLHDEDNEFISANISFVIAVGAPEDGEPLKIVSSIPITFK
jgi:hypothetical protein